MIQDWFLVNNIDEVDSPALVVYKERVQHNIALAIQMVSDPSRIRPHVKTHKSPQATGLMLEAGITKFKCATIGEAEMLAQCDAPDVLLAYQPTGPKIHRLLKLVRQYSGTYFSCLIDSADAAIAIANEAVKHRLTVNAFIDVNTGMNRTGVLPEDAILLYETCMQLEGIKINGLHAYDGHINDADMAIRKERADEAFGMLETLREVMITNGMAQPVIVIGGSPAFAIHAKRKDVECSPGTFVYWDRSYQQLFPDLAFLPAVLVVSRVVSLVNERRICLDLGHKSIAAENPLNRRVYFLNVQELEIVGQSEEHLIAETTTPHTFRISDILYGMPFHVCPTCALYDEAYVVEDGKVKDVWKMSARDRKISI